MYTANTFRFGRTALSLAGVVGLLVAFAGASASAAELGDVDSPIEPTVQQVCVVVDVHPTDTGGSIVDPIAKARAIELFRQAELGIWTPPLIGTDQDAVARAIELRTMAEVGLGSPSLDWDDPVCTAQALELFASAEGKR